MDRIVYDAEGSGTSPATEVEARGIVQNWLAVYWPADIEKGEV